MATNDPTALLKRLLQEPAESPWLEFKQNNCDPDLIGRTISACANSAMLLERDRAFIVWGVENKTKKRIGTTVRLKQLTKGAENLENWLNHVIEPRLMMELKFESAVALPHQSAEEVLEKLNTATYYSLSGQPMPANPAEVLRKFVGLGAVREDMEAGYEITNLGAILFANDITQFPSISSKSVRVIKYSGVDKRNSESEIEGKKGYAVGFPGMLKYIGERLPREETYDKGIRKVVNKYSAIAVREILANALIHQDFTITGAGPVVEIYQDRLEVTNPGNSLVEVHRIIDERRSRNVKLAEAMREMGLCEERGGGIDKAILEIEQMFLPAPLFVPSASSMRVVLPGPKKFNVLSKSDKIWACFCHCVVRWIAQQPMSNTTLRERFSLADDEYQSASDVISNTRKAKLIKPADPSQGNKYAKYVPYWV